MARALKFLVLVALMLPVTMLASPATTQAQTLDECAVGELVDGACVVETGPPACPFGFDIDDVGSCTTTVTPLDTECPDGTLGDPGECYLLLEPTQELGCEVGELVAGVCEIVEPAGPSCPEGYEVDPALGGMCARFEPAEQAPPSCPTGARGEPGDCYILVAKGPLTATCDEGELVGNTCVIAGDSPVAGPSSCPVSATVFLEDDRCFTLVPTLGDGTCPADTTPNGELCERPVDLVPGALMCADGYGLINGECIRYEPATVLPAECPAGSEEDADGDCRKPVEDAAGALFCPDPAAALNGSSCVFTAGFNLDQCPEGATLVGSDCVTVTPTTGELVCPVGSELTAEERCYKPVADVAVDPYCLDDGAELTEAGCVIRVGAICEIGDLVGERCLDFYCAGELVTINMQLGESGLGTSGPDVILGTNGDDEIEGLRGDDVICALDGRDIIDGSWGDDLIFGGAGRDKIDGSWGDDELHGSAGNDNIKGSHGDDVIYGHAGNDKLDGGSDRDRVYGGEGNDNLFGGGSNDRVYGDGGNDRIDGGHGNDKLYGNAGIDQMEGGWGNDLMAGGSGNDTLLGEGDDDTMYGQNGVDTLDGGWGRDVLRGGTGDDILQGGRDNDRLKGQAGHDTLQGDDGRDKCDGGVGIDAADATCEIQTRIP